MRTIENNTVIKDVMTREQQLEAIIRRQQEFIEQAPAEKPKRRLSGMSIAVTVIAVAFMVCSVIFALVKHALDVQAKAAERAHVLAMEAVRNQPEVVQQTVEGGDASLSVYIICLFLGTAIILYCIKKFGVLPV